MTDDRTSGDDTEVGYREAGRAGMDRDDWVEMPTDPDPGALGYETGDWERIPTAEGEQVIFLPGEEENLEEDAFVVLEEASLCDLVTRR